MKRGRSQNLQKFHQASQRQCSQSNSLNHTLQTLNLKLEGDVLLVEDYKEWRRQLLQAMKLNNQEFKTSVFTVLEDLQNSKAPYQPIQSCQGFPGEMSFVRCLLNIESLQEILIQQLLDKVVQMEAQTQNKSDEQLELQILILDQFHWVELTCESKKLMQKLLEVMSCCGEDVKCKIIQLLPEIATEDQQQEVMNELTELAEQNSVLLVPVTRALRNLNLTVNNKSHVLSLMLQYVDSVECQYLPQLLEFLLSYCTQESVGPIIKKIRTTLHFNDNNNNNNNNNNQQSARRGTRRGQGQGQRQRAEQEHKDFEEQVFYVLFGGFRRSGLVYNAVVKELQATKENLRVIDVWVFLMLMCYGGKRGEKGEQVLLQKFNSKLISDEVLETSIRGHGQTLKPVKSALLMLPQLLMRLRNLHQSDILKLQTSIYILLFQEFENNQQEVFYQLHSRLGSSNEEDIEAALAVLQKLIEIDPLKVAENITYLDGVLQNLESYSDQHILKLLTLLYGLCYHPQCSPNSIYATHVDQFKQHLNQLISIPQHQENSPSTKIRITIAANLSLLHTLHQNPNSNLDLQQQCVQKCFEILKGTWRQQILRIISVWLRQYNFTNRGFLDQLQDHVMNLFDEQFVEGLESQIGGKAEGGEVKGESFEGKFWMNLDGENAPMALKILPLVTSASEVDRCSLSWLCDSFGLLCDLLHKKDGEKRIEECDALLGCPLVMSCTDLYQPLNVRFQPLIRQQVAVYTLTYAINWLRQVVNCWTTGYQQMSNVRLCEIEVKILSRVRQLNLLEILLKNVLGQCQGNISIPTADTPVNFSNDPACAAAPDDNNSTHESSQDQENQQVQQEQEDYNQVQQNQQDQNDELDETNNSMEPELDPNVTNQQNYNYDDNNNNLTTNANTQDDASNQNDGGDNVQMNNDQNKNSQNDEVDNNQQREDGSGVAGTSVWTSKKSLDTKQLAKWKQQKSKLGVLQPTALAILNFKYPLDRPWRVLLPFGYILTELGQNLSAAIADSRINAGLKKQRKLQFDGDEVIGCFQRQWGMIGRVLYFAVSVVNWMDKGNLIESFDIQQDSITDSSVMMASYQGEMDGRCEVDEFDCCRGVDTVLVGAHTCVEAILGCTLSLLQLKNLEDDSNAHFYTTFISTIANQSESIELMQLMEHAIHEFTNLFKKSLRFSHKLLSLKCLKLFVESFQRKLERSAPLETQQQDIFRGLKNNIASLGWNLLQTDFDFYGMEMEGFKNEEFIQDDYENNRNNDKIIPSGWRQQKLQLQYVLKVCIDWNQNPIAFIYGAVESYLQKVPENSVGKKTDAQYGIPSLTGGLFIAWFKTLFEGLLQLWGTFCKRLISFAKRKSQSSLEEEEVRAILLNMDECIKCFVGLIQLTKIQQTCQKLIVVAVQMGGKFVKEMNGMLPFWYPLYKTHINSITAVIKKMQSGTRILQVLCSEGKIQKDSSLIQQVPETKKQLEDFVFKVQEMLKKNNQEAAFWKGNLKHKNLSGQVVPSQAFIDEQSTQQQDEVDEDPDEMEDIEEA